ncbi:MAG: hypothetical protein NUV47_01315, partial [Patescibacteria group bacterium]|nr:hypothetical protein [Patescibacteria group bacterium]
MNKLIIASNNELRKLNVKDNHENLVDLRVFCPKIVFKIAHYIEKNGGCEAVEDAHFARKGVAERLNIAQDLLSTGFRLMIECAHRSPKMQQKS